MFIPSCLLAGWGQTRARHWDLTLIGKGRLFPCNTTTTPSLNHNHNPSPSLKFLGFVCDVCVVWVVLFGFVLQGVLASVLRLIVSVSAALQVQAGFLWNRKSNLFYHDLLPQTSSFLEVFKMQRGLRRTMDEQSRLHQNQMQ